MKVIGIKQANDKRFAVVFFEGGYTRFFKLDTILEDVKKEHFYNESNYNIICFGVACIKGEI